MYNKCIGTSVSHRPPPVTMQPAAVDAAVPSGADAPLRVPELTVRDICTWTQSPQLERSFRSPAVRHT